MSDAPGSPPDTAVDAIVAGERTPLIGLAYRMLGTLVDAEDAVQLAYERWYRMPRGDRAAIANPGGWLMRVVGRICLDELGTARARRERYVGDWLPEPLPPAVGARFAATPPSDPAERAMLEESVSTAVLVLLESLSPSERVAFVLHDVFAMPFAEVAEVVGRSADACRQLASVARRRVREGREGAAAREQHDATVRAFLAAAATGELGPLVALLDPDVRLVSDGGGLASAARRPVHGADGVARFVLGLLVKRGPALEWSVQETAGGLGVAFGEGGVIDTVTSVEVRDGRIARVWIMRNPEKLVHWNRADSSA